MFIELHIRPKGSKIDYKNYLFNVNNIILLKYCNTIIINDNHSTSNANSLLETKESYDDVKKMLDKHNLLITN